MNLTVYVDKEIAEKVKKLARSRNCSRSAIVNEALREWLKSNSSQRWPKRFFDFEALSEVPDFKSFRRYLKPPKEDPVV
jgi:post-segregation antitoxin (ccd killing protein)